MQQDVREGREDAPPTGSDSPVSPAEELEPSETAPAGEAAEASPAEVDFRDRWLRAEAEVQNARRRARRDVDEARRAAEESVLLDLVAWLDDLERAIEAARASGASPSWAEGVALVLQKGREYLERQGVEVVDPVGQPFDPAFQEAVLEVEAPEGIAVGQVTQVVQKGYRRGVRPLRAARVVVARAAGPTGS